VKHKYVPFLLFIFLMLTGTNTPAQDHSENIRFTILHTNDEHSHLIPHPAIDDHPEQRNSSRGGFARLAGAVKEIREEKELAGEPVLIFSGGDILGGPAFGWLPLKEGMAPEMKLFHEIGYDAVTIGNHEFDYGPDVFADYLRAAGYPEASSKTVILGTNTRPPSEHPLSDMGIKKHYIKELPNGLKVGIFGLLGDDAINKTAVPGPVNFEDPVRSARIAVEQLRADGADILISVNHSGVYEDRVLAQEVPEIDVIVGGHSHTPLYEPVTEGKTVIVQAGSYLNYLGVIELEWLSDEQRVKILNPDNGTPFLRALDSATPVDDEVAEKVEEYKRVLNNWVEELTDGRITDLSEPIAESSFVVRGGRHQSETAIGNYITDAMKRAAESATGKPVDVAVQANGAIRSNITPGTEEWSEGLISFYDLVMATGLGSGEDRNPGYPLVSFYTTETEIRRALEVSVLLSELMDNAYFLQFSGLRMMYDPNRAVFMRVPFTGTPIPSSRAVLSAELVRGDDEFHPLSRNGEELLHVVTDRYIAGFLPLVGDVVPHLAIELRDENGEPVELDDTVIYKNGSELKVWQAVLDYTLSHETGENGLPVIPSRYEDTEERLKVAYTLPLWVWPLFVVVAIIAVIVFFIRRRRAKRKARKEQIPEVPG
jgi:5'-nucleotidase / UDP-sugar diphosphatase